MYFKTNLFQLRIYSQVCLGGLGLIKTNFQVLTLQYDIMDEMGDL